MELMIELSEGKAGIIPLKNGDILITNQRLPISLKDAVNNALDEEGVLIYSNSMKEAEVLIERYGEEKIYVVEAVGECYEESNYFYKHAKILVFRNGEFHVKKKSTVNEWVSIHEKLPPCYTPVKVKLTNGLEAIDYVNEPINKDTPFQHYLVSKWRELTEEELLSKLVQEWV